MANSIITYEGDGSTTQYAINFTLGILNRAYVQCRVGTEVDGLGDPVYRTLEWVTDGLVNIQGTVPADGVPIVFTRTMPKNALLHNYSDGAAIVEGNLDQSNLQHLMSVHEFLDGRLEGGFVQDIDMNDYKIVNLADGTDDGDAVNKAQLDEVEALATGQVAAATAQAVLAAAARVGAETAETNAETAETNAEAARVGAETAEANAETAETAAEAARDKAQLWADEDEDVAVEPGLYSAKHWAAKAEDAASGDAVNIAVDDSAFSAIAGTNVQAVLNSIDTDLAGDISNARLADMATLTLKANITGGAAGPVDSTLSAILDACAGSTRGQLLQRSDSLWQVLAPGTAGQVLTSGGAGADNAWAAPTSKVVQMKRYSSGAVTTGITAVIPYDDTIPQNTEGTEWGTLAITPQNASNRLLIEVKLNYSVGTGVQAMMALFQDAGANALATANHNTNGNTAGGVLSLSYEMAAGTTSETTFKVRVGTYSGGTLVINGAAGARLFGGTYISSITITEFTP